MTGNVHTLQSVGYMKSSVCSLECLCVDSRKIEKISTKSQKMQNRATNAERREKKAHGAAPFPGLRHSRSLLNNGLKYATRYKVFDSRTCRNARNCAGPRRSTCRRLRYPGIITHSFSPGTRGDCAPTICVSGRAHSEKGSEGRERVVRVIAQGPFTGDYMTKVT